MKTEKRLKQVCIIIAIALFLSIALCACNNTVKNAKSFYCSSERGDTISFDIKTKIQLRLPGPMAFKSDIPDFDDMVDKMKAVSPQYDYSVITISNQKVCFIHNNSQDNPCSYMLKGIIDDTYNYSLAPETANCAFAQEFAFPHRYITVPIADNAIIMDGALFEVSCTIEEMAEFYRDNNYTVNRNNDTLEVTDNCEWTLYEGQTNTFRISFSDVNGKTVIQYNAK